MRREVYSSYEVFHLKKKDFKLSEEPHNARAAEIKSWYNIGIDHTVDSEVVSRWLPTERPTLFLDVANLRSDPLEFAIKHGTGENGDGSTTLHLEEWYPDAYAIWGCLTLLFEKDKVELGFSKPFTTATRMPKDAKLGWAHVLSEWVNRRCEKLSYSVSPTSNGFDMTTLTVNVVMDAWHQLREFICSEDPLGRCPVCSDFFLPSRSDQVHCSTSCRTRAHRAKKEK